MFRSTRLVLVLSVVFAMLGLRDVARADIVPVGGVLSATATGSAGTDSPPISILGSGYFDQFLQASVGTGTGSAQMHSRSERTPTSLLVSCSGFVGTSAQGSVTEIFNLTAPATLMIESSTPLPDSTSTVARLMFGLQIGQPTIFDSNLLTPGTHTTFVTLLAGQYSLEAQELIPGGGPSAPETASMKISIVPEPATAIAMLILTSAAAMRKRRR